MFYLITYDIPSNKRRKKISDLLAGYGKRVQLSVFECVLPAKKYQELQKRLQTVVNLAEDNLRFYPITGHTLAQVETWGGPPLTESPKSVVV